MYMKTKIKQTETVRFFKLTFSLEKNDDILNSLKRSRHGMSLKAGDSDSSGSSSDEEDADPASNMGRNNKGRYQ